MREAAHGHGGGHFNASRERCARGSFRRTTHLGAPRGPLPMCPMADEYPSASSPRESWVLRGGSAQALLDKIEEWRAGMASSDATAAAAIPLSARVRRAPGQDDLRRMEEVLGLLNLTHISEANESEWPHRLVTAARTKARQSSIMSFSHSNCIQAASAPLPVVLAFSDVLIFFALFEFILVRLARAPHLHSL